MACKNSKHYLKSPTILKRNRNLIYIRAILVCFGTIVSSSNALTISPNSVEDSDQVELTTEPTVSFTKSASLREDCECGTKTAEIFGDSIGIGNLTFEPKAKLSADFDKLLTPDKLIVNGVDTVRGEIPWMVAITKYQHNKLPRWRVVCGGAVLSERYVLTAAHCLQGKYKDTLEAVFNVGNASLIASDSQVVRRKIQRFIIHPEYNSKTVDNDIALIELAVPLNFSAYSNSRLVRPVCIPTTSEEEFYVSKTGVVSGWGITTPKTAGAPSNSRAENSDHLLKIQVPIFSRQECLKTDLPKKNNVTENMICAGYLSGGYDACVNDSGGPMTVEHNSRMYIVGLVSWGWGCAQEGYPGVYTNVGRYTSWIQDNILGQGCGRIA